MTPQFEDLWSLEHVVYILHMPNPGPLKNFRVWGMLYIYNPGHQNFGF